MGFPYSTLRWWGSQKNSHTCGARLAIFFTCRSIKCHILQWNAGFGWFGPEANSAYVIRKCYWRPPSHQRHRYCYFVCIALLLTKVVALAVYVTYKCVYTPNICLLNIWHIWHMCPVWFYDIFSGTFFSNNIWTRNCIWLWFGCYMQNSCVTISAMLGSYMFSDICSICIQCSWSHNSWQGFHVWHKCVYTISIYSCQINMAHVYNLGGIFSRTYTAIINEVDNVYGYIWWIYTKFGLYGYSAWGECDLYCNVVTISLTYVNSFKCTLWSICIGFLSYCC